MRLEIRGGSRTLPAQLLLLGLLLAPAAWARSPREFAHSHAVVVGIRSYGIKQWSDLPYGRTDAEAMAAYLKSQGFEVTALFDSQATKHNIMEAIIQLATRLQPDDRVVFYFSGHGTIERNGDETWGYIVPYGGTEIADYISNIEIQDLSRRMKTARHQLFIFDSCFSGQMITRSGGVSPDIPNYIEEVTKRIARQGLAAGGRDQPVLDSGPDGHSVFTSALLKGLACKADLNGDGFITFAELESFIIPLATNPIQTPAPGVLPGHEGGEFVFRSPCGRTGQAASPGRLPKIVVKRGDTDQLAEAKRYLQASDFAQALPLFQTSAAGGNAEGMFYLGRLYEEGWGVLRDYRQAWKWWEKAAEDGNADAMFALGSLYESGDGAKQGIRADPETARQWWEKAAEAGSVDAMLDLGELYVGRGGPQDYEKARKWWEKAAEAGFAPTMGELGSLYERGEGVPKDYQHARQLYQKAADAGEPRAMNYLVQMYNVGKGVPQDYQQARLWFEKSAAAGYPAAMGNLGIMYFSGRGVEQDYEQARQWFEKGAAAGNADAMGNLGTMYLEGYGVPRDDRRAFELHKKAAEAGSAGAMFNLGLAYEEWRGVPKDNDLARQWYEKAAAAGVPYAKQKLQSLPK